MKTTLVLLVIGACAVHGSVRSPTVELDKGSVQGRVRSVEGIVRPDGTTVDEPVMVNEFFGIPFAKPPLGELRFSKPQAADAWTGTLDATRLPPGCVQNLDEEFGDFMGSQMWNTPLEEQSEDCLYLNVWAPAELPQQGSQGGLAVLVWIYGGGFWYGSASLSIYEAHRLAASQNVIVVSMQYRLGMFGFAGFEDQSSAPGNVGLFDQRLALDWVQLNIQKFGGNPRRVTIFGESAGSVSVSAHLLSDNSEMLFERAILQSGTINADWAFITYPLLFQRLQTIAEALNCTVRDSSFAMLRCFRKKPAAALASKMWVVSGVVQFPMIPVIDGNLLKDTPHNLLKHGNFPRRPIMIGSNSHEGHFFNMYVFAHLKKAFNKTEPDVVYNQDMLAADLQQAFDRYPVYEMENTPVGKHSIVYQYTDWAKESDDTRAHLRALDHAVGDFHFICPAMTWAQLWAERGGEVFMYKFVHRSSVHLWGEWTGVLHGDEISFVFGAPMEEGSGYTHHERRLSADMMQKWARFAQVERSSISTFDPTWPVYTPKERAYLELGVKSLTTPIVEYAHRANQCAFWMVYMPHLMKITEDMSLSEQAWKDDYYEWSSSQQEWKAAFNKYKSPKNRCPQLV